MSEPSGDSDHDHNQPRSNGAALGEALRGAYHRRLEVPAARDSEIRRAIAAHFAAGHKAAGAPPRGRPAWRWGLAAAAALALTGSLWMFNSGGPGGLRQPRTRGVAPGPPGLAQRIPADLDGNGVVNILDAFVLARRVDGDELRHAAFDLNGDGRTDRGDVDVIAMQAVALGGHAEKGTGS